MSILNETSVLNFPLESKDRINVVEQLNRSDGTDDQTSSYHSLWYVVMVDCKFLLAKMPFPDLLGRGMPLPQT